MQHLSIKKKIQISTYIKNVILNHKYSDVWPFRCLRQTLELGGAGKSFLLIAIVLFSCTEETSKTIINKKVQNDTIQTEFSFTGKKDTLIQNGEHIKYYKNGVIEIQGSMKNGKRDGLWKSYYEDGSPWSETIFKDGKKNGKTTTWYDNEKKRYDGFYTNDDESGKWIFWDENGKIQNTKNY